MTEYAPPGYDCPLCPRLLEFHQENRTLYRGFHNGPVPSFGEITSQLLVVGLAPGLKGANRTGRPFTGDYAGLVLYSALRKNGFAKGEYDPEKVAAHKTDGFELVNCRITNAVRCVPPGNKPETTEIKQCNSFLSSEIRAMEHLRVIVTLGQIAHKAVIQSFGLKQSHYAFAHGASHGIERSPASPLTLINSYHSSRYNINTGTLTQEMFDEIIAKASNMLGVYAEKERIYG